MLKVGLTGGIGSGKSTVSAMLRELGAHVVDADVLAHEALEPRTPGYKKAVCIFGKRIVGSDGRIDRRALAEVVFDDPEKRHMLERIVHPSVFAGFDRVVDEIKEKDPDAVVFFDAALLVETGAHEKLDRLVVVWCRPETQMKRLVEKCGLTRREAELRIASQMPMDEKKSHADYVVDNDGDLMETRAQVERIYRELKTIR
jgi:dephospho-CoA kinase